METQQTEHFEWSEQVDNGSLMVKAHWPDALIKACGDEFTYALGLRGGTILEFNRAEFINEKWVKLHEITVKHQGHVKGVMESYCFERGLDLKVIDIMWVADAPNGS